MTKLIVTSLALALLAIAALAPPAWGDGLPVAVDTSPQGVVTSAGDLRYVAIESERRTAVAAVDPNGGTVLRSTFLDGRFTIPAVAYDGSASGLSADRGTLVLIRPRARFPRRRTSFAVVDPQRMRLRKVVRLRGDFSFDALSPDGSSLFLIQYLSRRDPSQYHVRVYDLRRGRLEPKPIVDPRESAEEMYGYPVTRATSPDGRWAYTLYDSRGEHPFIHALDTRERRAVCIDLDGLDPERLNPYDLRLDVAPGGRTLSVVGKRGPVAIVNARTFGVSEPPPTAPLEGDGGGPPWAVLSAVAALLLAASAVLLRRRRRRPALVGPEERGGRTPVPLDVEVGVPAALQEEPVEDGDDRPRDVIGV
jgi:hypothetical protein